MTSFDETQHPRSITGTFTAKPQSAPDIALSSAPRCTEGCGSVAEYRYSNVPRGYRSPGAESLFCALHAASVAAEGRPIEAMPRPQEPGESVVWLIEGDDHEYVLVEATTESDAIDQAAQQFEEQYDDDDDDDDDDRVDPRDFLAVRGVFRGEVDGYSDELDFVPYGDIDENTAYDRLEQAV